MLPHSSLEKYRSHRANLDSPQTYLTLTEIDELRKAARAKLLQMHFKSGVGHIGGNLSCIDLLLNVFHENAKDMDHVVLSKGHAAGALYVTLWSLGIIEEDELSTFHKNGTRLSGHPAPNMFPAVPFATGSLGHGTSLAAGMAKGLLLQGKKDKVVCITSDGEWNEGSTWEALIFATHHKLKNLVIIIDYNKLQGFGSTDEIANLSPFPAKFDSFGLEPIEIDGHSWSDLTRAIQKPIQSYPRVIIAHTVKGKGVSFMENKMEWHYLPMKESQYIDAIGELENFHAK